jgi:hypothetical protein
MRQRCAALSHKKGLTSRPRFRRQLWLTGDAIKIRFCSAKKSVEITGRVVAYTFFPRPDLSCCVLVKLSRYNRRRAALHFPLLSTNILRPKRTTCAQPGVVCNGVGWDRS